MLAGLQEHGVLKNPHLGRPVGCQTLPPSDLVQFFGFHPFSSPSFLGLPTDKLQSVVRSEVTNEIELTLVDFMTEATIVRRQLCEGGWN